MVLVMFMMMRIILESCVLFVLLPLDDLLFAPFLIGAPGFLVV